MKTRIALLTLIAFLIGVSILAYSRTAVDLLMILARVLQSASSITVLF